MYILNNCNYTKTNLTCNTFNLSGCLYDVTGHYLQTLCFIWQGFIMFVLLTKASINGGFHSAGLVNKLILIFMKFVFKSGK